MLVNLKHKVEYTLLHHEKARSSNNSLVAHFLHDWYPQYFADRYFDMTMLKEVPSVYDIIRWRQKIQNEDGNYKPSKEVQEKRYEKQKQTLKEFGYNIDFVS